MGRVRGRSRTHPSRSVIPTTVKVQGMAMDSTGSPRPAPVIDHETPTGGRWSTTSIRRASPPSRRAVRRLSPKPLRPGRAGFWPGAVGLRLGAVVRGQSYLPEGVTRPSFRWRLQ
jgi:hypothetical protein